MSNITKIAMAQSLKRMLLIKDLDKACENYIKESEVYEN